eukprot:g1152.t1
MAMAAVLENFALHSFSFEASETQVGDISGIAFAKSLHSSASLRRFSFVGNFCNVSEETCRAMGEAVGSTCLTAFEFSALHLFVSERTSICLRNALQRNNSLESIKFQTCQLDGDRAYTAVQEAVGKAIFKRGQRRCEHQPGCPCFQLSSDMPSKDLETSCLSCSDWGSAIVIEKESGEDAAFRSGKLSYADSLSETDIGDGEAEAITTVSSQICHCMLLQPATTLSRASTGWVYNLNASCTLPGPDVVRATSRASSELRVHFSEVDWRQLIVMNCFDLLLPRVFYSPASSVSVVGMQAATSLASQLLMKRF